MSRDDLSRPIALALTDGIISRDTRVLDYGCGRGGDLQRLKAMKIRCHGWDPHFRSRGSRREADVVNLGYVINVIENHAARDLALKEAWKRARRTLVVAARLVHEIQEEKLAPRGDGYLTSIGTFQKYYEQQELGSWIETTLGETPIAAAPGVFYIFKTASDREAFLASRYHRRVTLPRLRRIEETYKENEELLGELMAFVSRQGRLPADWEFSQADEIRARIGSMARAFNVVRRVTSLGDWEEIRKARSQDMLVYLALARFGRRHRFTALSPSMQMDIKAFFGSYQKACDDADQLLMSAGDWVAVDRAIRESKVGKETPEALYVHISALSALAPVLRAFEGCARVLIGSVEGCTIIKLSRNKPKVSYLGYPDFDENPHPALKFSISVSFRTYRVKYREYTQRDNPPVLHRKELFVTDDYPKRAVFRRLTEEEEKEGLYANPSKIGTLLGWSDALTAKGIRIEKHRVLVGSR